MKKFALSCGLVAGSASALNLRHATSSLNSEDPEGAVSAASTEEAKTSCGTLKLPPHAKAAKYADGVATRYSKETKKHEPVMYYASDSVELKCEPGFTLTGAKDGPVKFETVCSDAGYYKPSAACTEASKCGELPAFANSHPTGEVEKRVGMPVRYQYTCDSGFSLDGEKVVEGGLGKNQLFSVDCEATGMFGYDKEKLEGETCKPYSFVGSTEIIQTYNAVFKVLWEVECKNTMTGHDELPAPMESVCAENFSDKPAALAECKSLVAGAKTDIIAKNKEANETIKETDSLESSGFKERDASAKEFCKKLSELHWQKPPADAPEAGF